MKRVVSMYSILLDLDAQNRQPGEIGFWNYGYWLPGTKDLRQASLQLMERLIDRLPRPPARILDVAFGKGTSTKCLCQLFGRTNVAGINIAPDQVEFARQNGVTCELKVMDAASLEFDAGTFDGILCMEAAFHFRSRKQFIRRAHSVLKRGGRLVMSDFLLRSGHGLDPEIFPPENQISTLEQYRELFADAGFTADSVFLERSTNEQLVPTFAEMARELGFFAPESLNFQNRQERWRASFIVTRLLNIWECVIVVAEKA